MLRASPPRGRRYCETFLFLLPSRKLVSAPALARLALGVVALNEDFFFVIAKQPWHSLHMIVDPSAHKITAITTKITAYYVDNARNLPWRSAPGGALPDPYRVWLSEVMLQQTSVAAVRPYFEKFTRKWPDIRALAAAREDQILAAWAGLGYYSRARSLHECARIIVEQWQAKFPQNEAQLRTLPGIGQYSAAAIAAIAFGRRAVVVDTNIDRLMARLFAIATPLPRGRKAIYAAMDQLTPEQRAGDFAQACMDLGARLCTAKRPGCARCPVAGECRASRLGRPTDFPVKPPKKTKPARRGRVYWIERDGSVALIRRARTGMLAAMLALPDDGWNAQTDGDGRPPLPGKWQMVENAVQHSFTHFTLDAGLALYRGDNCDRQVRQVRQAKGLIGQKGMMKENNRVKNADLVADDGLIWWPLDRLDQAGLPSLFARLATCARAVMAEGKQQ